MSEEFIQKFIVEHRVECPWCEGGGSSEFGDRCNYCLGSGWVDDRDLEDEDDFD